MSSYFFIPTRSIFGEGCVNEVGELVADLGGKKPLIVTDAFLGSKKSGMADDIAKILSDAGLKPTIFAGAQPNPTDKNCDEGNAVFKKNGCDFIISLGGGSAHDCAKGIAILATNGGKMPDYEGVNVAAKDLIPIVAINTTAGTASEMTQFAVITDSSRKVKMVVIDWRCTPKIGINDPALMVGMPPSLTANTGMDALTHAVEAYVSVGATPLTDACAIKAMQLIAEWLPKAVANGTDIVARDKMAYAEYLAGCAFNNAGLGYVHAMAHQLGGMYDLAHGECNAVLLPYVSEFNIIAACERYADVAEALGVQTAGMSTEAKAESAVVAIHKLSSLVGIIPNLHAREIVKPADFEHLAENAMKDLCASYNPRLYTKQDVIDIYQRAYDGTPLFCKF